MAEKELVECPRCEGSGAVRVYLGNPLVERATIGDGVSATIRPYPVLLHNEWIDCPECKGEGTIKVKVKRKKKRKHKKRKRDV